MSTRPNHPAPAGYGTVTPWIIARSTADLLDYVAAAFDAEELARIADEHGIIGHAEFRIGDSVVMAFDGKPHYPDTPAFLRLYVHDGDATYRRAVEAGGTSVTEPTTAPFGDRVARVRDPFGNLWWIHTRVEDVPEEKFLRRFDDPEWIAAMEYLQGAELVPPAVR
ncbi:VOC family protein [Amycolatopsis cihanbeyliensis]|uniref:Putative glyoxalase superfamily protein PhnB n=1 Tax=Amycolatopsis cihanbeyliensis TaxID=1128664 RepID=A0A542DRA3_AMYCI|nr:VOC family protein [Amycolatopsis cihanbeyliensis]TQJ05505.1 putative glyoxalase superfamily protein PhnB [Amycolatopsis cihanbeyliensis]